MFWTELYHKLQVLIPLGAFALILTIGAVIKVGDVVDDYKRKRRKAK